MTGHLLVFSTALALGQFTPAKVDRVTAHAAPLPRPPAAIYVFPFSTDQTLSHPANEQGATGAFPHPLGILHGDDDHPLFGRHKEQQFEQALEQVPPVLQNELIASLSKNIAPACRGDENAPVQPHAWVITGQFVVVDPGKRAMQAMIGFGAGESQVEVHAQIHAVNDPTHPFLIFDSEKASGHAPGAILTLNPYVAAVKFVMTKDEPQKESKKIGDAIAKEIGKYMAAQHIATLEQIRTAEGASVASTASTTPAPLAKSGR
ncbi:MAG: DUF4410 domain-containing protein [Verrucomicrobiota bacterium]